MKCNFQEGHTCYQICPSVHDLFFREYFSKMYALQSLAAFEFGGQNEIEINSQTFSHRNRKPLNTYNYSMLKLSPELACENRKLFECQKRSLEMLWAQKNRLLVKNPEFSSSKLSGIISKI